MDNTQATKELANVFVQCFSKYENDKDYLQLHNAKFVDKTIKKSIGKKKFDEYDTFDEQVWYDAWMLYSEMLKLRDA